MVTKMFSFHRVKTSEYTSFSVRSLNYLKRKNAVTLLDLHTILLNSEREKYAKYVNASTRRVQTTQCRILIHFLQVKSCFVVVVH